MINKYNNLKFKYTYRKEKTVYCIRWGGYKRVDNNKKQQRQQQQEEWY